MKCLRTRLRIFFKLFCNRLDGRAVPRGSWNFDTMLWCLLRMLTNWNNVFPAKFSKQFFPPIFPASFRLKSEWACEWHYCVVPLNGLQIQRYKWVKDQWFLKKNQILLILHEIFSKTKRFPTSFAELLRGKKHGA